MTTMVIVAGVFAALGALAYLMWPQVQSWVRDSETLLWVRMQLVVGAVWQVLAAVDLSPILPPEWLTWWLIGSGIVTEILRRSRATDL